MIAFSGFGVSFQHCLWLEHPVCFDRSDAGPPLAASCAHRPREFATLGAVEAQVASNAPIGASEGADSPAIHDVLETRFTHDRSNARIFLDPQVQLRPRSCACAVIVLDDGRYLLQLRDA